MKGTDRYFVRTSATTISDLRAAKRTYAQKLIHSPRIGGTERAQGAFVASMRGLTAAISPSPTENVVGVGVGEKITDGKQTGIPAVKFLVRMKYAKLDIVSLGRMFQEINRNLGRMAKGGGD